MVVRVGRPGDERVQVIVGVGDVVARQQFLAGPLRERLCGEEFPCELHALHEAVAVGPPAACPRGSPGEHVVVEVLAHPRQLGLNLDPVRAQVVRRPDPRDHRRCGDSIARSQAN